MPVRPLCYRSQLLRYWQEQAIGQTTVWRFSMEHVETGERRGFADLEALVAYLRADIERAWAAPTEPPR
ncbi:MAG: hypothetical protein U1F68_00195 [Gammaproteobacteria bacterium]